MGNVIALSLLKMYLNSNCTLTPGSFDDAVFTMFSGDTVGFSTVLCDSEASAQDVLFGRWKGGGLVSLVSVENEKWQLVYSRA